jgi:hypothetical protein
MLTVVFATLTGAALHQFFSHYDTPIWIDAPYSSST